MEKPSAFLRQEAKKRPEAAEVRSAKAAELVEARTQDRERRERLAELAEQIENGRSEASRIEEGLLTEAAQELSTVEQQLKELRTSKLAEVWNWRQIKQVKAEIAQIRAKQGEGESSLYVAQDSVNKAQEQLYVAKQKTDVPSAHDILNQYYEDEKALWENREASMDDVAEYFRADKLADMDMESYVDLLRRFPSEMVTHVSRRGIRDHAELSYHTSGLQEYHAAFDSVLETGRLQSAISIKLEGDQKDDAIAKQLKLDSFATKEEAYAHLDQLTQREGWNSFADHSAVHFATEWVADAYYGSERDNEVFIAFPSALIASEFQFGGGHGRDLTEAGEDSVRNDLWVWQKDEEGIPIDAGVTFLPKEAAVDPETGSRYELDTDKNPIVDTERVQQLKSVLESGVIIELAAASREKEYESYSLPPSERVWRKKEIETELRKNIQEALGISDKTAKDVLYDVVPLVVLSERVQKALAAEPDPNNQVVEDMNNALIKMGAYYKTAERTIPSQEYWNKRFEAHPDQKPSKVVFYEGDSPSAALYKWRKDNGLTKRSDSLDGDLNEKKVTTGQDTIVQSRYKDIARSIIDKHFDQQDTSQTEKQAA
ncbi:hypothetical protein COV06_01940 [Candidatus Uhrbacteria bacterium CG10_big_fil_rev_8_21_14_0_10_50_16]|uniref:Uncharacterized protein n=1 Tax=Candidatus Uhrbacteria bacterium CG10_big_fil_rev_8_21_14_0_10_50_16 TaxID=1975039 RepID=A0A2H0RMK7_9BACT|nr:MAG: hypothetical protein COV06_01940 [Candidatus Uhrbacteria bacterium CG10_big_fil_rev_8_21_14_0_10_50_16]